MQFGQILPDLLYTILHADPCGGPVFISNIDLLGVYIRVWIRPEDLPRLAFVTPPRPSDQNTPIGFHLSLLMGYVDSAP